METYIRWTGWIIIVVGIICGFAFASVDELPEIFKMPGEYDTKFIWPVAWFWWIFSIVGGSVLIGLSKIIETLSLLSHDASMVKGYVSQIKDKSA